MLGNKILFWCILQVEFCIGEKFCEDLDYLNLLASTDSETNTDSAVQPKTNYGRVAESIFDQGLLG